MKDYQSVVTDRYDQENDQESIYSPDKPVGKYIRSQLFPCLKKMLKNTVSREEDYSAKKMLDVGCGNGGMISFFIGEGFRAANITGIDLSEKRIAQAKDEIPEVNFTAGNGLSFQLDTQFDLVTSFDMFSHIVTEKEIVDGLINIRTHLAEDGVFLWYDIFSKDHYSPPANGDSWGFSADQMEELGRKAGFIPTDKKTLFKNMLGKYNSVYQVRRFPAWMVKMMEKLLPGTPGNVAVAFRKA